jgi:hypothetical protein
MFTLLLTMMFNQRIDDFSTHQTPPARHPDLSTRSYVHKVIHNHCALASGTLHPSNLLQHGVCVSIGGERVELKSQTQEKMSFLKHAETSHQHKITSGNDHSLSPIVPAIHSSCWCSRGPLLKFTCHVLVGFSAFVVADGTYLKQMAGQDGKLTMFDIPAIMLRPSAS